jgi:hypothetical protein
VTVGLDPIPSEPEKGDSQAAAEPSGSDAVDPDNSETVSSTDSVVQGPDGDEMPRERRTTNDRTYAPGFYRTLHGTRPRTVRLKVQEDGEKANLAGFRQYALASALETGPATLDEALAGPNAQDWKKAWDDELGQLVARKTWEIVDRPPNKPVIPHLIVLCEKPGPQGKVLRQKARLVAGGHKQEKGINYEETFAAVARVGSIRIVLSIAAHHLHFCQK